MTDIGIRSHTSPDTLAFAGIDNVGKAGPSGKSDKSTNVEAGAGQVHGRKSGIELDGTSAKPDASAFQSLLGSSDEISLGSVMKLLISLGQANWQANMENRQSELNAQVASIHKQADKMRSGALLNLVMGVVFGAVGIIGGIVSIAGSAKALKGQKSAGAEMKQQKQMLNQSQQKADSINKEVSAAKSNVNKTLDKMKADGDITELFPEYKKSTAELKGLESKAADANAVVLERKAAFKEAKSVFKADSKLVETSEKKWQGTSGSMSSVAKIGEGAAQGGSQIIQSQSKLEEADQTLHQAKMQQANDYIQHYNSMIRDVRNMIAQINQDMNQTARSVLNKA